MSDPARDGMLAICASMRWELRPVLRSLPGVRVLRNSQPRAWLATGRGRPVLVFQTGVGMDVATKATQAIMSQFALGALINTGCAGALSPRLSVGAVVCARELLSESQGQGSRIAMSPGWTQALVGAAEAAGLRPIVGATLTSPIALVTAQAKNAAFDRSSAVAVEMEGAAIAQIAADAGVELASVRVVLDDVRSNLPANPFASKTMLDFARKTVATILSVEELTRFSVAARNALIVDRVLATLFNHFLRSGIYTSRS